MGFLQILQQEKREKKEKKEKKGNYRRMRSSYENERKRGRRWLGKLEIYWHWHCDYNYIVFIL
jgi:Uri superfamily endonuclease